MTYIDSPNRRNDLNNTSPITLFDSPSLSGNRFNYQALSCESPPANFDDLRTPIQVSRRPLDSAATSTAIATLQRSIFSPTTSRFNTKTTTTTTTTNGESKIEEEEEKQEQQKILTSPIKTKSASPIVYKPTLNSPLRKNINWLNKEDNNKDKNIEEEDQERDQEEKDLMTLDVSPINTIQKTEYKIVHSTPIRQEFQNNNNNTTSSSDTSSPIKFSPIVPLSSSKEMNHHHFKKSPITERYQQRFSFDKDHHDNNNNNKKSPITTTTAATSEKSQQIFSFDKDHHDNNKKSPITAASASASASKRSQQRFSFDKDRDYTFGRTTLTERTDSPIKRIFNDDNDKKVIGYDYDGKDDEDNNNNKVDEKSNVDDDEGGDSLSFLQKSYSERIKKSSPPTTTNVFSRFTFHLSPNKQDSNDDDTFEYTKPSTSTPPRPHLQSSPLKYKSSPQRYKSSPQKNKQTSTYRSPVYSNSSYKCTDKKQSPIQLAQKSVIHNNNNSTDDTIKQSSSFAMKSPFISPIKPDDISSHIRSPYSSRALYNNSNHSEDDDINNESDAKDNNKSSFNNTGDDDHDHDLGNNNNNDQQKQENKKINLNSQLSTITNNSSIITNNTIKNDNHSERATHTQTSSSQDSGSSSSRSSRRRYKYSKVQLPHYMLPTESFQHHIQTTSEHNTKLHKTISRGVTKKSTSNLSRFKSSTKINAVDDIRKEMLPDDVYVPLAARIKLFEKGLGNGIKPAPINNQKQSNVSNSNGTVRLTKPKSPVLLTRERSLSHHCYRNDELSSSTRVSSSSSLLEDKDYSKNIKPANQHKHTEDQTYTIDRDHRATKRSYSSISSSISTSDKNDHQMRKNETKRQRRFEHPPLEVKPFHFATDKRAARYQELFRAKLRLWKEKEDEVDPSQKRHK